MFSSMQYLVLWFSFTFLHTNYFCLLKHTNMFVISLWNSCNIWCVFRSGLDTEKETFNILSPSQNPLPNDILLILDLQFMDIEIWCSCAYDYIRVETDTYLLSAMCVHQTHKSRFQKHRLKMQQCYRNIEVPVLYKM